MKDEVQRFSRWRKTALLAPAHRHLRGLADSSHGSKFSRRATQFWAECFVLDALEIAECRSSPHFPVADGASKDHGVP